MVKKLIKATEDQVREMGSLVCQDSDPMGLGFIHHSENHKFPKEVFELKEETSFFDRSIKRKTLDLDYVAGRMVKLYIREVKPGYWDSPLLTNPPHPEYQGWVKKFPTLEDLVEAVGASIVTEAEEGEDIAGATI